MQDGFGGQPVHGPSQPAPGSGAAPGPGFGAVPGGGGAGDGLGVREDGGDALRPWLPADLLDNAARTISENKAIMLGLPVLAGIALAAVQAGLTQLTVPGGISGFLDQSDPFEQAGAALILMYAVQLVLFAVVSSTLAGIIALAAVRSQLGRRLGPRELLRLVRPALLPLAAVGLLQSLSFVVLLAGWGLAVFGAGAGADAAINSDVAGAVALLLMLLGGLLVVIFGIRLVLAGTVVLLEGKHAPDVGLYIPARVGAWGALKRSWQLVKGKFWRVFGILLFGGVVVNIVSYALQFGITTLVVTIGSWADGSDGEAALIVGIAVAVAAGVATVLTLIASLAFMSAVQALIYLDLRVRREGLDLWMRPSLRPTVPGPTGWADR
ncbi:hypothetical protein Kfla_1623 [Kribbella flavida DSM 17836]|uniref:Glycerophosphoryl diester phosphodiesterase membrane domain-containing protein n=1 Tax=Kribbella flavida (strain DSM 17836 / JCM 10339 / NBRC 14399) TaxID=479435 RepID=D2PMH4_KRIFD|nr:hypothetical protein [Kribbella flavida]ADB30718.1 hypothetical protein Kfla_1623 [Kribbella flavida DSM 17836]